jgi:outer membrane autotransporter protein
MITVSSAEAQLQIVSGNRLSGGAGETVGPFTVQLVDQSGAPVTDQSIVWRVIPDNAASLSETVSTTDELGQATTSMTIQQVGVIKLVASQNDTSIEFLINSIAARPGLTDNQAAVGSSMDNLCLVLAEQQATAELSAAQQDLLMTCSNLVVESAVADSLTRLAPEEVAAQGTASIEAASTQLTNLNTRLVALRGGDTGMNLSGLTVNYAGISFNQRLFEGLYPVADKRRGGSAGDLDELQGRWGGFVNGSINFGEKDRTDREAGFEFDTSGITLGLDYRFNPQFVAGSALGFSRYDSDYSDAAGRLEMDAWNLSAYATYYHDNNLFVDGLFQYGSNSYDTERRINPIGGADQFGRGDTEGMEYSLNLSAGYEYRQHAMTLTPYARFSYTRVEIDGYTEQASNQSAAGFGSVLHIEDQVVKSSLLLLGGSFSYSFSTRHGVVIPQLSFEWEHQFEDDTRTINAGFAHDPTRSTFAIETDEVDTDYFNLGVGLTAVFAEGKSGYLFYETRMAQDNVSLNRINAGIRMEF